MIVLPATVDFRECMTCEHLRERVQDGSYYCGQNGEDVSGETVEAYRAPVWCPDLSEEERIFVSLLGGKAPPW